MASKGNGEAKEYLERLGIDMVVWDMLNATLHDRCEKPLIFMIRFLGSLVSPKDLLENGIVFKENDEISLMENLEVTEKHFGIEDGKFDLDDFPELKDLRLSSLEETLIEKSPENLSKIDSVGSRSFSSESLND